MSTNRFFWARVCPLVLITLFVSVISDRLLAADVVISSTGTLEGTSLGVQVGQSFKATKSGRLTKIEVAVEGNSGIVGTATLKVYQGAGLGGVVLYSKTGIDLSATDTIVDENIYTFHAITIDSVLELTSGVTYTFAFSPADVTDLGYIGSGGGYADGELYDGALAAPEYDLAFRITQSDPPATVPGAPTIGNASAGNAQALVTFTAPASDGGSPIISYTATSSPGGIIASGNSSPITVTGLTNGTSYTFTVKATNAVGTGAGSSASNNVTPRAPQTITFNNPGAQNFGTTPTLTASASSGLSVTFASESTGVCTVTSGGALTFITAGTCTIAADQTGNAAYLAASTVQRSFSVNAVVPSAPAIGTATAGDGQATVTFTTPPSTGGAAIVGYTATSNPGGLTASGNSSPITVSGLTNGTTYSFTVTATNSAGTGAASAASTSVTPKASQLITFNNPGAQNFGTTPTLTATASSGLTVTFSSATTSVCTTTSAGALTFVTAGTCTINADQAGNASFLPATQVSRSFTVNPVTPGAPTIGVATAGAAQATVAFSAPASNGGGTIVGYTVTANPGGLTGTGASSPITVTGLTNGVTYTFTVTASNSAGTGAASAASNSVTPVAAQTITFNNPGAQDFGTSPTLSAKADSGLPVTFTSSTTSVCTITAGGVLTFASTGTCTINADQAGNASFLPATQVSRSFVVNAVTPGAPTIGAATPGDARVTVTFTAPGSSGGAPITGYEVIGIPGNVSVSGPTSPIVVTGLANGTAYQFAVKAINSVGAGPTSAFSVAVTPAAPTPSSPSPSPNPATTTQCEVSLNKSALIVPAAGELGVLNLSADSGCSWTLTSAAPWVVAEPTSGVGSAVIGYVAQANAADAVRETTIVATSATTFGLRVSQQGRGGIDGAPLELSALVAQRTVRLAWQLPAGANVVDHMIELGSSAGQTDLGILRTGSGAPGFVATNVPVGTYYLRVRGITATGTTGASNEVIVAVEDAVAGTPMPPADLAPLTAAPSRMAVRWSASADATSYLLEFGSAPGRADLTVVSVANTSFDWDASIAPAFPIYVRVRAVNSFGQSGVSNELVLSRGGGSAGRPGPPLSIDVTFTNQVMSVSWVPPASGGTATAYVIEVGSFSGAANLLQTTTTATTWTQFAPSGVAYYIRVRALNAAGVSAPSEEVVLNAGLESAPQPGGPGSLVAQLQNGRLTLQWTAPASGAAVLDYVVEAGSAPGQSDVASISTSDNATVWFYDGVPDGQTFYVRVRARNAWGVGAASNEVRVGPPR